MNINPKRLFLLITSLVVLISLYEIGSAVYISRTTGTLIANSSTSSALITVSRSGDKSVNIGTGGARVRLQAGSYQLIATSGMTQVIKTIQINKRAVTSVNLSIPSQQTQSSANPVSAVSLTQLLPFVAGGLEFRVDDSIKLISGKSSVVVTITAPSQQGQQDGLKWIRDVGYNPSDYNIEFVTGAVQSSD